VRKKSEDQVQSEFLNGRTQMVVSELWYENCNDTSLLKLEQFLKKVVQFKGRMVKQVDLNLDVLAGTRKSLGEDKDSGVGGKPDFDVPKLQRIETALKLALQKILGLKVGTKDLQTWRQHIGE
jgi:hypothetical protein